MKISSALHLFLFECHAQESATWEERLAFAVVVVVFAFQHPARGRTQARRKGKRVVVAETRLLETTTKSVGRTRYRLQCLALYYYPTLYRLAAIHIRSRRDAPLLVK